MDSPKPAYTKGDSSDYYQRDEYYKRHDIREIGRRRTLACNYADSDNESPVVKMRVSGVVTDAIRIYISGTTDDKKQPIGLIRGVAQSSRK